MDAETAQFVKNLFIKHAGFVPESESDQLNSLHDTNAQEVLVDLCEALNIYVDSDEDEQ